MRPLFILPLISAMLMAAYCSPKLVKPSQPEPPMYNLLNGDYPEEWRAIDSLENSGLYKSALERVLRLQETAKKENNGPQVIKTMVYRGKYTTILEEDGFVQAVAQFDREAQQAGEPERSVIYSMLGELYAVYYQNQLWRIRDRTPVPEGEGGDIQTWSAEQIVGKAREYYILSVRNDKLLQETDASYLKDLSMGGHRDTITASVEPTLFNFLSRRAIDFFTDEQFYLTEPVYKFYLDDQQAFAPARDFIAHDFASRDSASGKWLATRAFQKILAAHLSDKDPSALVFADLQRLQFVYNNAVKIDKNNLYERALRQLLDQYRSHPAGSEIAARLATYFMSRDGDNEKEPQRNWLPEAVALLEEGIRNHPDSYGADECRELLGSLKSIDLQVNTEYADAPGRPVLISIAYKNVPKTWVRVVKGPNNPQIWNEISWENQLEYLRKQEVVQRFSLDLPDPGDYRGHRTETGIKPLSFGEYFVMVSNTEDFDEKKGIVAFSSVVITNLSAIIGDEQGLYTLWAADRLAGNPLAGVQAEFWTSEWDYRAQKYNWKKKETAQSDANGKVEIGIASRESVTPRLSKGEDVFWVMEQIRNYGRGGRYKEETRQAHFFTDRALYRPGQTVYFKAVLLRKDKDRIPSILPNETVTVQFLDANYQKKGELTLRSNEYGTIHGAFTAPSTGLTGAMTINIPGWASGVRFQVEEYKRPKFEVTLEQPDKAFRLNETIEIAGKAQNYAGNAVDGARVNYRVVRSVRRPFQLWWRYWDPVYSGGNMEIANGATETDAEGKFTISFDAVPDFSMDKSENPVFDYSVTTDVVDITGETRSGKATVSAGYVAMQIETSLTGPVPLDSLQTIRISAMNLAGKKIEAAGKIVLQRLVEPKQEYVSRYWAKPDQFILKEAAFKKDFPQYAWKKEDDPEHWGRQDFSVQVDFDTRKSEKVDLRHGTLKPGYYLMTLQSEDSYGEPVEIRQVISLWDEKSRRYAFAAPGVWTEKSSYQPGEQIGLWLGGSQKTMNFLYAVEQKDKKVDYRWIKANEATEQRIPVAESDRGGISVYAVCVRDNRLLVNRTVRLEVPWSNKELNIRFETYRDKLEPGSEEEWRIRIQGPDKDVVAAELAAAMYDASLDQFMPHQWSRIGFPSNAPTVSLNATFGMSMGNVRGEVGMIPDYDRRRMRSLQWFNFPMYGRRMQGMMRKNEMLEESMSVQMMRAESAAARADGAPPPLPNAEEEYLQVQDANQGGAGTEPTLSVRKNLNETVFFFPVLQTDGQGDVILKFKMNEALTRWKLLTFAHSKSLQNAVNSVEVVTQKELMVTANPPRFLRAGDEIEFTAKVSNLSEQDISATVGLELLDALSLENLNVRMGLPEKPERAILIAKGASSPVAWRLSVPEDFTGAVTWRVMAAGGKLSDGEESTLPVVSNRILVTETLPITVRGGQTKTFAFEALKAKDSQTLQSHRYTLEFTSNPVWYAVQALPYLMEYPHECSEQIFSRLYANSLASSVTERMPKIRQVYERWKGTDAMKSPLAKNQELKSALLEETPWVLDAQQEEQQRQQIALLFDLNRMADEKDRAIRTLAERQLPNGAWAWFPGGRDNWYITQYIAEGFAHLDKLGALGPDQSEPLPRMIEAALGYCDGKAEEVYREIEKEVQAGRDKWENDHLDNLIIHYLYTRSFYPVDRQDKVTAYFLDQAEKFWLKRSLYEQGMIALALHRQGRKATAALVVKSLKERAIVKEELGMYWVFDWGYYWYQLPIETQALMVEVFHEVAADQQAVEDLRIWLLKNKQTNRWNSTKSTAEAVYALLLGGSDNWLNNTQAVQVSLGRKVLKPGAVEAGTGYFKQSWQGEEVGKDWASVKVENPNPHIVWGAAYWQYFEDIDKITSSDNTPLRLVKQLFVEEPSDTGPKLRSLDKGAEIKPGDKLKVRIEIRVDRPMEFVHLKDMRAAGLEPVNVLSGYRWQGGLGYYESTRDLATHFFIDYLPRGTFVLEYPLVVNHRGNMSGGMATLQCMYAPEFSSHTSGTRISVK